MTRYDSLKKKKNKESSSCLLSKNDKISSGALQIFNYILAHLNSQFHFNRTHKMITTSTGFICFCHSVLFFHVKKNLNGEKDLFYLTLKQPPYFRLDFPATSHTYDLLYQSEKCISSFRAMPKSHEARMSQITSITQH